ncbi:MAG: DUF885 domain-containing protein [Phycisphaerae bacterium]|nr:DUF885 domain-containing protein [Phycisphaerae bacterium]
MKRTSIVGRLAVAAAVTGTAVLAGAGIASAATATPTAPESLHRLFADRFAWEMNEYPASAMRRGDYTNAHRIADASLDAIERRHAETGAHLDRLLAIDRGDLDEDDLVSYELFELKLRNAVAGHRFRMFLAPVGQRFGPQVSIPQMADRVRFESGEDYENYLSRLKLVPAWVDATIERLRLGVDEGRTAPRVSLLGVPEQLDALLAEGGLDALAAPLESLPARLTAAERETVTRRWAYEAEPAVRDGLTRLRSYFVDDYLPNARETIAATSLPDGPAYYQHQLRVMTTTDMTAQEIHTLGLREVKRIRAEMMDVIRRSDFMQRRTDASELDDDTLFRVFLRDLRTNPRFYYDDPEELLAGYRNICKLVDGWLPKFFHTLPRLPYGVKEIPAFMAPHQTTAYYQYGSQENGEAGTFYANTYALDQRPKYEMIALAMHEAVPGHHLQSALAQELENVPEFRKNTWFTAFGEGWALYSERLGMEMGLYDDPYDDFGRLLYEMWRACRLVVDPGMHALGWSRDRAVQYMLDNTALSELNINTEIDRYIAWPGQACAYKIGELRIRALRQRAEAKLTRSFDLRAFHDVVLGAGSVPLSVLERRVEAWIRSHPAGMSYD